jgi:hypothetical protein
VPAVLIAAPPESPQHSGGLRFLATYHAATGGRIVLTLEISLQNPPAEFAAAVETFSLSQSGSAALAVLCEHIPSVDQRGNAMPWNVCPEMDESRRKRAGDWIVRLLDGETELFKRRVCDFQSIERVKRGLNLPQEGFGFRHSWGMDSGREGDELSEGCW